MSMTVEEAIENLKSYAENSWGILNETFEMAISALEEIQQYRAIGTVSDFRELKANEVAIAKATAKKVFQPFGTHSYKCPTCWKFVAHEVDDNCDLEATMADYCPYCGQKLDWSEGKE